MAKANIEVSAELLVSIRFRMDAEGTSSLEDVTKLARSAAERVATSVIGLRGDEASASVQRITQFSTKLV